MDWFLKVFVLIISISKINAVLQTERYGNNFVNYRLLAQFQNLETLHPEERTNIKRSINDYKLPESVKPIYYNITLEPDLNRSIFMGMINIRIMISINTTSITLHSRSLTINENSISLEKDNGSPIQIANISQNKEKEFYTIHLNTSLIESEEFNLTIGNFSGTLNGDLRGFYLAKYYDVHGNERRLATTHFQPTYARMAFPCFDEPHLKANFTINLIRTENFTSLSNERLLSTKKLSTNKFHDTFRETPKMSTYLVAFVVSDYVSTNETNRQRVFADKESVDSGNAQFALNTGIEILNKFESLFGVNYSLSKIDQIAIPSEYLESRAMENWGLVTYKKDDLVYPRSSVTLNNLQLSIETIAHEYAHQWFGNLVTPCSWKYTWLSEGFATYFAYYVLELIRPSWRFMDQFSLASEERGLSMDILEFSKPLTYEEYKPSINPQFWVVYRKSSSILQMAEHFLTKKTFLDAVKVFLKNNAYGNVTPSILYGVFQDVAFNQGTSMFLGNLTVADILSTWEFRRGYPLVNVTRNYTTGYITLTQQKYSERLLINDTSKWYIPISYVFHSNTSTTFDATTPDFWMTRKTHTINQSFPTTSWIIVNKQRTGFYRVNYDETNWNRLTNYLATDNHSDIHVLNRAQLLSDAFSLAQDKYISYHTLFNLTRYIHKELDYVPLYSFVSILQYLDGNLLGIPEYAIFKMYINNSFAGAIEHLGFEEKPNDEYMDKLNRVQVVSWLCHVGNTQCTNYSLNKLHIWKQNGTFSVPADLKTMMLCTALKTTNESDWNFVYQTYELSQNISRGRGILQALACTENKTILIGFLDKIFNINSTFNFNDSEFVLTTVLGSGALGFEVALEFINRHFARIKRLIQVDELLFRIVLNVKSDVQFNKFKLFADNYPEDSSTISPFIRMASRSLLWFTRHGDSIKSWLNDYYRNNVQF